MKFQTFTKKEEVDFKKYQQNIGPVLLENLNKNYNFAHKTQHSWSKDVLSAEYKNSGVIILTGHYKEPTLNYNGILCNSYIEYLGFRDTKKFNKMLTDISKSLEDICYVHTGEKK